MIPLNPTTLPSQRKSLVLTTIILLFFFQLLTEFVEAIYIFGLLGSSIPPEIGMVLLFLAALVLYAFGKRIPPRWVQIFAVTMIFARSVEIALSTRGQMIVSGLGVASFLLYVPSLLAQPRTSNARKRLARAVGYGLTLAVIASVLMRSLLSGSDITAYGMFRVLTWGLAAIALYLILRTKPIDKALLAHDDPAPIKMGRVYAYVLGLASVVITLYFSFTAPNVIARWAGVSWFPVFTVLLLSWILVGWWWLRQETISSRLVFWWGLAFATAMLFAILPHQVSFPPTQDVGYPLLEPKITPWHIIPLYLMLILSPVLVLVFVLHLDGLLEEQPKQGQLAGAFGLAGLYIMIMVFAQVFTTVYDYIPVIGPFFRDKFWLVFLVPSLGTILPALLPKSTQEKVEIFSATIRRDWLVAAIAMSVMALVGLSLLTARPGTPISQNAGSLRVFTYNIQQGYDDPGEQNFDDQIALIRSKAPDILGLQECDTARIAGGNVDVVAYFADRLNMYSYYGPSPVTGTFGIALLSRYPIENPRTLFLYSKGEQVAVIEADISIGEETYKVYVTHLGNSGPIFQISQMLELMRGQKNVIAMGDFNFRPYEEQYALTTVEFEDAYVIAGQRYSPDGLDMEDRIDHIFVSLGIQVGYLEYLPKGESDHPALFVDIIR
jgi:endonuclease/exonuclease/phosphatase family metal-dependent hydrolase